jgi:hypothetical protein
MFLGACDVNRPWLADIWHLDYVRGGERWRCLLVADYGIGVYIFIGLLVSFLSPDSFHNLNLHNSDGLLVYRIEVF